MRPAPILLAHNNTSTAATNSGVNSGFHGWNSPIPYLFGGLAIMLGLIAFALLILACSYRKNSSNNHNSGADDQEKPTKPEICMMPLEMAPKLVILAGDENPMYLAKPVSLAPHSEQV